MSEAESVVEKVVEETLRKLNEALEKELKIRERMEKVNTIAEKYGLKVKYDHKIDHVYAYKYVYPQVEFVEKVLAMLRNVLKIPININYMGTDVEFVIEEKTGELGEEKDVGTIKFYVEYDNGHYYFKIPVEESDNVIAYIQIDAQEAYEDEDP